MYKTIEEETSYKAVVESVDAALLPFIKEIKREVVEEDIERLLEIRIKRISRYDINKQLKEIKSLRSEIRKINKFLKDMVGYTTDYIDSLLNKYGESYPRLTELKEFTEVSVRKVALSNLTVCYDREEGFVGHMIKAKDEKKDFSISCSEYDRLLLIYDNGTYKVVQVTDKLFVGHDLLWLGKVEKGLIFNIIYREGKENLCYVKRFKTPKFILDKEYLLFDQHKRSKILLFLLGTEKTARASLMPSPRARTNAVEIVFDEYLVKGAAAKGKRVSTRTVRRISNTTGKAPLKKKVNLSLPGLEGETMLEDKKDEDSNS